MAMMWTAILCVQAGAFLQNCIEAIWPSFKTFPNHLPENAGIDCKSFCPVRTVETGMVLIALLYSCWVALLLSILDDPDCSLLDAYPEAPAPVPSKSHHRSTNLRCSLSMGRNVRPSH